MDTTKTETNTTIDNTIETTIEIIIPIEIIETIITPDIMTIGITEIIIEKVTTQDQIHEITLIHTIEHQEMSIDHM